MKKIICLTGVIVFLLSLTLTAVAGDVPEALLGQDDARLYVGKVLGVTTKEHQSMPYEENEVIYIDIEPTFKYKGEVEIGVPERHTEHDFGTFIPKKDEEYLFGYIDENNFYIYEIEYRNEEYIKLSDSDKYDMVERLENYINEGAFERAEEERASLGDKISFLDYLSEEPLSGEEVAKVTIRCQDVVYEVSKDQFMSVAEEILITNVKNGVLYDMEESSSVAEPYKTILYIELLDKDDRVVSFGAVSRFGEVDRYGLFMGRLMMRDMEMSFIDLRKLYSLFPEDLRRGMDLPEESVNAVPKNIRTGIEMGVKALIALAVVTLVLVIAKKRKNKA